MAEFGKDESVLQRVSAATLGGVARKLTGSSARPENTEISHLRGFGPMTRISTSFGELPAQALRVRDQVRTRNGGFKAVQWVDRIILDTDFLQRHPAALPIIIRAGSLGHRLPAADIILAPHQPISASQKFHGQPVKRALDAMGRPNVARKAEPMVTYTLFHCGTPTSVLSEGIWLDVGP